MKTQRLGPSTTELSFADGTRVLLSYDTPVAGYAVESDGIGTCGEWIKSRDFHSRTTSGHVSRWLRDNGATGAARAVPQEEIAALLAGR